MRDDSRIGKELAICDGREEGRGREGKGIGGCGE